MTVAEMHTGVKIQLDKIDSLSYPNFTDDEIDYMLNREQDKFVKHRADGTLARNRGFEETQKRMDDLRAVTGDTVLTPDAVDPSNKPNGRFVTLPNDPTNNNVYWFAINEEAIINVPDCDTGIIKSGEIQDGVVYIVTEGSITYNNTTYSAGETFTGTSGDVGGSPFVFTDFTGDGTVMLWVQERVEIKPLQHDDYNKTIKDPFNKPVVSSQVSQLRRLQLDSKMEILLPDGLSTLNQYILRYIRKPRQISLTSSIDCELAEHTHQEIVDMTVASILETIESGRYQTNLNELGKFE